jgi:UDP-GlcNAc:undecaprenyl-phosphate GlcNAc-1-phosphate transferase
MGALEVLIVLVAAAGVAALATPPVARLARALGVVDRPSERGVSRRADMPLLGGLAVAAGFAVGLALALALGVGSFPRQMGGLVFGGTLILLAGVYDDRFGMNAWWKFGAQIAAALIALGYGFQISHFTEPVTRTIVWLPAWLAIPLTGLWIVGITNALNLIDGLDGLASGVGAIIGATLTLIAWQTSQSVGFCLGIALVGALVGFLPWNFHPARIFLGDTGSMLIGYLLSLLALEGYRQLSLLTFVVPLLALAVPILDTALSIVRRVRLRTPIFSADRLHMHHRLLAAEGSQRAAVLQFYFLTGAFCLIALSFTRLHGAAAILFLAAVAVLTLRLLWNLGVLSVEQRGAEELRAGAEEKKR